MLAAAPSSRSTVSMTASGARVQPREATREYILWVMLASAGFHIAEETLLDFVSFASAAGYRCSWHEFDLINLAYVVAGVASAAIGWRAPALSLSYPALLLINAVFHT